MKMNKITLAFLIAALATLVICLSGCKKQSKQIEPQTTQTVCKDISAMRDVQWKPYQFPTMYPNPKFSSDGKYYETGILKGNWTSRCDCVFVTLSTTTFWFKVGKLTNDTLQAFTMRYGTNILIK